MSRSGHRILQVMGWVALCVLVDRMLDWTGLRSKLFNGLVDSISLSTRLSASLVGILLIGGCAFLALRLVSVLCAAIGSVTESSRGTQFPPSRSQGGGSASP